MKPYMENLIRIHAASLKEYEDFEFIGELSEMASENKQNAEELYYTTLGYVARGGYSARQVAEIRKLSIIDKNLLKSKYNLETNDDLNKLLGVTKAVAGIVKKGSISENIINEVRVLSQFIMHSHSLVVQAGDKMVTIGKILRSFNGEFETFRENVEPLIPILRDFIAVVKGDSVSIKKMDLVTPNYEEVVASFDEVIFLALLSTKYPITYMHAEIAVKFGTFHHIYFDAGFKADYLVLLDYLHYHGITVTQLLASIGQQHPDFMSCYRKTETFSFKVKNDMYIINNNYLNNEAISSADFVFCLERNLLSSLFSDKGVLTVYLESNPMRLSVLRGVG